MCALQGTGYGRAMRKAARKKDDDAARILERPAKAGVLLYENDKKSGARKFLVPYNEGRFAREGSYFVLPKGSVDYEEDVKPGEKFDRTPIAGGIRETSEETGFPLKEFLGEESILKLEHGETLRDITNAKFPGFKIVKASPRAYPHVYHARGGKEQTMVMYAFQVEGLDTLKGQLKNSEGKSTKEFLDERPELPRFPTFLSWMKQGYIPASGNLPQVNLFAPGWFDETIARLVPEGFEVPDNGEATRANWQEFCASLDKKEHVAEHKLFRKCFHRIKTRLQKEGLIKGDLDVLKFDEKDCPLFYYTEGAVVEDEGKIIRKTLRDMVENDDYRRAFGGSGTHVKDLSAGDTMVLGQVAAYGSFVRPSLWRAALSEIMGETGKLANSLIKHSSWIQKSSATQVPEQASGRTAG